MKEVQWYDKGLKEGMIEVSKRHDKGIMNVFIYKWQCKNILSLTSERSEKGTSTANLVRFSSVEIHCEEGTARQRYGETHLHKHLSRCKCSQPEECTHPVCEG